MFSSRLPSHTRRVSLAALCFMLIPLLVPAVEGKLEQVGQLGGAPLFFAVKGQLAYCYTPNTLKIMDISEPNHYRLVGSMPLVQYVMNLKLAGDLVLVGSTVGLQIVDVHDPANPHLLSTVPETQYTYNMIVDGHRAYSESNNGCHIIDLSDPANPVQLGVIPKNTQSLAMAITGNLFYFADGTVIGIIDVSNPAKPVTIKKIPQNALSCCINGARSYVYSGSSLIIYDYSHPDTPAILGTCPVIGLDIMPEIQLLGNRLLLLDWKGNLRVVDVSDPAKPVLLGSSNIASSRLVQDAGRVFVSDSTALMTLDLTDPTSPTLQTWYDYLSTPRAIAIEGDLAYIVDEVGFLWVMKLTDPLHPETVGRVKLPLYPVSLTKVGKLVYVACPEGLNIVDVADPAHPRILGHNNSNMGEVKRFALKGSTAYLACGASLSVLDISDPTSPTQIGFYKHAAPGSWGFIRQVKLQGDRAYVQNDDYGLEVLDISEPAQPKRLASGYTSQPLLDFDLAGQRLYVAEPANGLAIYDIGTSTTATLAGVYHHGDVFDVKMAGSLAYVVLSPGGMQLVDLSDPGAPRLLASTPTAFDPSAIEDANGYIYACGGASGLCILRYQSGAGAQKEWTLYDR